MMFHGLYSIVSSVPIEGNWLVRLKLVVLGVRQAKELPCNVVLVYAFVDIVNPETKQTISKPAYLLVRDVYP